MTFKALAMAATLATLSACTAPGLERARVAAWVEAPYITRPGDWTARLDGDCKNKAMALRDLLEGRGYAVDFRVGCRTDRPGHTVEGACNFAADDNPLHIVPVVTGRFGRRWVIDVDRVWPADGYPMAPHPYDWRTAAAEAPT